MAARGNVTTLPKPRAPTRLCIMNEVTNKNYKQLFPSIKNALKKATFIGIDLEFTGLPADSADIFFDDAKSRYSALRSSIQSYTIVQFGITTFCYLPAENEYEAASYSFYLLPRSAPSAVRQLTWEVSTLEFLSAHKFDFNRIIYDGISYLNAKDQKLLQKVFQSNEFLSHIENQLSYEDGCTIKDNINKIQEWLTKQKTSTTLISVISPHIKYLLHKDIRKRFPNIWTINGNKSVTAMRVSTSLRNILEVEEKDVLEQDLFDSYTGFSKVVDLLQELKKPIVGHNLFFDLMFIYQQFYEPLPENYIEFKTKFHSLFPNVYDTRYISLKMQSVYQNEGKWKGSSLHELYKYFRTGPGAILVSDSPKIHMNGQTEFDETMHHAGWDSYVSAYIFSRFLYLSKSEQDSSKVATSNDGNPLQILKTLKNFANYTIAPRCMTKYINLSGTDTQNNHPVIHVKTLEEPITMKKIVNEFSNFGTVDMLYCSKQEAVLTVASNQSAQRIFQHFEQNKQLSVTPYTPTGLLSRFLLNNRYMQQRKAAPFLKGRPWVLFSKFCRKLISRV